MSLEQEQRMAFNTAAKVTNRFVAIMLNGNVRIAFAEAAPGETKAFEFHGAVMMSSSDAKELAALITEVVAK